MSKPPNGDGSTFTEVGGKTLEMFSEGKIALIREVAEHPVLQMNLRLEAEDGEEGAVIGTIAAFCNIKMDGTYSRERLENLYPILVDKLRQIRRIKLH
jgi:hypothetical protein